MISKKYLIILLVVVIAIGVGVFFISTKQTSPAHQATPTPSPISPAPVSLTVDETANWKTYRNDKYGFEFKYPEKYSSHPSDSDTVLLLKSDKDAQTWDIRISWYVWDSGVKSINELTNLKNSILLKIGSEDAVKLSSGKESKQVGYIFIHNDKEYDLEINTVSLKIMDDVGQIFSTFRFIK